ncbi:MAG: hypothetical protein ACI97A_001873 [Planctomycetota bacterium]|jgi:hypothetical protein
MMATSIGLSARFLPFTPRSSATITWACARFSNASNGEFDKMIVKAGFRHSTMEAQALFLCKVVTLPNSSCGPEW